VGIPVDFDTGGDTASKQHPGIQVVGCCVMHVRVISGYPSIFSVILTLSLTT